MQFIKKLQDQTPIAAGGDTGNNLQLSSVDAALGGRINYIDAIAFSLAFTLNFVATAMGAVSVVIKPQGVINQVLLSIPTVGILVQMSGDELTRMYRLRHRGDYPPGTVTAGGTAATPTATAVTTGTIFDGVTLSGGIMTAMGATLTAAFLFDVVIEFADPEARDADDFAIPAALLANAQLKVTWCSSIAASGPLCVSAFTNLNAANTISATNLVTTVISRARPKMKIPKLTTLEAIPYVGTQPNLDAIPAAISHEGIAPQSNDGVFTAADYGTTGLSWGGTAFVISEDILPTGRLYDAFNLGSRTDIQDSTQAVTERTNFIPVVWPPDTKKGQSLVTEVVPAGLKPRIRADVSVAAYKVIRRTVWAPGPWMGKVRSLLGIAANVSARVATANGNPGQAYAAELPLEIT